jgi:hypothetical protein
VQLGYITVEQVGIEEENAVNIALAAIWPAAKAAALSAVLFVLTPFTTVSSAETGSDMRGCWERADSSTRYPTSLTYCFLGEGRLQGWDIDYGHGVDFYGSWEKHKPKKVVIATKRAPRIICNYEIDKQREVLHLKSCTSPSVEGSFNKSGLDIQ